MKKKNLLLTIAVAFGVSMGTALAFHDSQRMDDASTTALKSDPVAGASVGYEQRMEENYDENYEYMADEDNRADPVSGASAPLFEGKFNRDYHTHQDGEGW